MRPIVVLGLVLAAVAGLYFAFQGNSTTTPQALGGPDAPPEISDEPSTSPAELDGEIIKEREQIDARTDAVDLETPDAAPTRAGLTGIIVGLDEKPLQGARVVLTRHGTTSALFIDPTAVDRSRDKTTKTDSSGRYSFTRVDPFDRYALLVSHSEFAPLEEGGIVVTEGELNELYPIQLNKGVTLSGTVTDTAGNTVPNAEMELGQMALAIGGGHDPNAIKIASDSMGKYEFKNLAKGNFVLQVKAEGYGQVTLSQIHVAGDGDMVRDITLDLAMALGGVVTDENGVPLKDVKVTAYSIGNRENRTQTQIETDAKGEFLMHDVPAGHYTLRAQAVGFRIGQVARAEAGEMHLQIALMSLPKVSGQVVDAATGSPVRRFSVSLRHAGADTINTVRIGTPLAFTDEQGRFTLPCPKAGNFMVQAESPDHAASLSDVFTIAAGQELGGITVRCTKGGGIKGVVLDSSGKPVSRAKITTQDDRWTGSDFDISLGIFPGIATVKTSRTNSRGEFSIDGLTPTTYLVEIEHKGFAGTAIRNVIVTEAVAVDLGQQVLARGATVSGTVRSPSGSVLAGSVVTMMLQPAANEFPARYTAKSDKEGRFRITSARPGTYWIHATRPIRGGGNPFANSSDIQNTRRRITVGDGQDLQGQDFDLAN